MESFNLNNLFIGISIEQIIVLLVLVLVSIVFGLFAGASIFYPLGYHRCRKDGLQGSKAAPAVAEPVVEPVAAPPAKVEDTFDTDTSYTNEDLFNFVDEEDVQNEVPVSRPEEESKQEKSSEVEAESEAASAIVDESTVIPALMDVAPGTGEQIEVHGEPIRDAVFVRLEAARRALPKLLERKSVLNYCTGSMKWLASSIPVVVVPRDDVHAYDRIMVNHYPFALLFEHDKVLQLVARMHPTPINALRREAGARYVTPFPSLGEDWYSWVITDLDHCEKTVAIVLDMSYRYTAHECYGRAQDGTLVPKMDSYEDELLVKADAYDPTTDALYMETAAALDAKYHLRYFGREEAARYVQGLSYDSPVVVESAGTNLLVFKVNNYMFCVVYESYGVVKILFRADKEYVEVLRSEHPLVGCSEVPSSDFHQWYYAILDESFTDEQCTQLLATAYNHVVAEKTE